jgi:hypothetical protein
VVWSYPGYPQKKSGVIRLIKQLQIDYPNYTSYPPYGGRGSQGQGRLFLRISLPESMRRSAGGPLRPGRSSFTYGTGFRPGAMMSLPACSWPLPPCRSSCGAREGQWSWPRSWQGWSASPGRSLGQRWWCIGPPGALRNEDTLHLIDISSVLRFTKLNKT